MLDKISDEAEQVSTLIIVNQFHILFLSILSVFFPNIFKDRVFSML